MERLDIVNKFSTSLDLLEVVAPTLEVLDLSECRLGRTSHAAGPFESAVLPVVAGMESLVGLNLKGNALGNSGWRPLGLALQPDGLRWRFGRRR